MCGIFGIVSNQNVAWQIFFGLYDLQERGEQGAGIVIFDGKEYWVHKGEGLVTQVFPDEVLDRASGNFGIGHTRYSTIGDIERKKMTLNIQPLEGKFHGESFWVAHNGNLIDFEPLKKEAEEKGYSFQTTSDTEVIVGLLSVSSKKNFLEALIDVLPRLKGAFSLVILYKDKVIGIRDRFGIRPLCLGRDETSWILASESCAFDTIRGHFLFDIQPGELIVLSENGMEERSVWAENSQLRLCIFELIYFAWPGSIIDRRSVYLHREDAGKLLAKEHPVEADIICPVPDSGRTYGLGFSQVSGIPIREGLYRKRHFPTKTFLTHRGVDRRALQRIKIHPIRRVIHEKKLVVTEDSIIRGNVSPEIVAMLREAGAREVHLRVGSSPILFPCYLGIDMPTQIELIAASLTIEGIRKYIEADTLGYLSIDAMVEASGFKRENLCLGCFTGEYPIEIK